VSTAVQVDCDTALARAQGAKPAVAHPRLVLATTILASSLAFIDGSVVNVGLPAIGRSLGAEASGLQWVINAYMLPLSALLLLGGAAGDRFGRRFVLVAGIALFAVASALCALAPNLSWLLAGRTLQGMGAAMLMPNSLAILGGAFSGPARGRAIGIWAATGAMAGAVGPVIGGWLIDTLDWRAIFLINLPFAAAAIFLALRFVPGTSRDSPPLPLDLSGALLATAGLAGVTWGLTLGTAGQGWTASATIPLCAGLVLLGAFLRVEKRRGDRAMMPLALFASRSFVGITLLTLLVYGALGALFVLVPYVLIVATGYAATAAGAALLPLPLVLGLMSPLMGDLAGRIGPRLLLTAGSLTVAAGLLLMLRIGESANYWTSVLPSMLVIAFGMSGVAAPLTTAVLGSVDARHTGAASGFNSAVARTGGLIATALLGSVLSARGAELLSGFRTAALLAALASLAAGVCAFALIAPKDVSSE
jgi:EmrB/QacA subfamily drug resistance transporter